MENAALALPVRRVSSMTSTDFSALRTVSDGNESTEIEGQIRTRVVEALSRVKTSTLEAIGSLGLADSTTRGVFLCLQRAIENEERRYETKPAPPETSALLALRFKHNCKALGCTESTCDLCESNPKRGCLTHFDKKYFKGDPIKAKCGGAIFVELVDYNTHEVIPTSHHASSGMIELCVIDGNKFEQLIPRGELTPQTTHYLESCLLTVGNEGRPLLQSEDRSHNRENGKVLIALQSPRTNVCDLSVHCSSEALLSGRRPPFRLVARYVASAGSALNILPAVSSNFIVASGRSRLSQKKTIPFADDPVSRLENMGKERIKKLGNLQQTAVDMGVSFESYSPSCVLTVADFKKLAFVADTNGQLKQKLLHMLKMSEKAWEETRDHAANAITNDTRMRTWHRPDITDLQGLAYVCYMGEINLHRPVALLDGGSIVLRECLDVRQRDLMKELETLAIDSWWKPNHPGWSFLRFDSEIYNKDHTALLSMGPLRSEHHIRNWPVSKQLEGGMNEQPIEAENERRSVTPVPKRVKKNDHSKRNAFLESLRSESCALVSSPISPATPEDGRSQSEVEPFPNSRESVSSHPNPPSPFVQQDGVPSRVPYSGMFEGHEFWPDGALGAAVEPVIPMRPPESAFTRRARGQSNCAKRNRSETRHRPIPDPALIEQFYVTTSPNQSRAMVSSGPGDVYTPLKTPFNTTAIALMKKQLAQPMIPLKSDSSEDGHGSNNAPSNVTSAESLLSANKGHPSENLSQAPSDRYATPKPSNPLSCSIESLSSQTKEAIMDEQRIRQMDKNGGYSNQGFQHSFEESVRGQMKKRASQSPPQSSEGFHAIPIDSSTQLQVGDNVQQLNAVHDSVYSYNIVLVPFSGDRMQESARPANI